MDLRWIISEEERTRHDALFYSQKPQDRYLSGEQARSLFIRSKLPLPELSKIWKLADMSRNNMLDIFEFAIAMHLIQSRLKGINIPDKLPETLVPANLPHVNIPALLPEEEEAYEKTFKWKNNAKTGYIDAETACTILIGSGLSEDVLARIWNLSDIDRDGKLSMDEFFVALHLTRFCKQGNSIEGTVNVRSILSQQLTEESYDTKKLRLAEVQTEKRKLLSLKEKLCHEIAGGLDDESVAQKVEEELEQAERQVFVLEKEENELRRTLQQLKDKSKRESFKPFDRSFLLKRQSTGEDIFRGASKVYRALLTDQKDLEIQKLWKEGDDLSDFGASISEPEEPSSPDAHERIRQDQFGRTVIELNQTQESSIAPSSSSTSPSVLNGNSDEIETIISHSVYTAPEYNNESTINHSRTNSTRKEDEFKESGDEEVEKTPMAHVDLDDKNYLSMNGSSPSDEPHTETNDISHSESKQPIALEASESTVDEKPVHENLTDDDKTETLEMKVKIDSNTNHSTGLETEESLLSSEEQKTEVDLESSPNVNAPVSPVAETVQDTTATTAQSSAATSMDGLLINIDEDEVSFEDQTRVTSEDQPPLSPRSMTQDELIPYILEEKKRQEEERAKQRELDEGMRQKAREDSEKLEAESKRIAEQRKVTFVEERRKLEHQTSLSQEGQERKKAPLSRSEAGRIIELELEEQRVREKLTRIETEKIKEKERVEQEKQKFKHAKKEEHPSAFQNKDLIQTPIFDETDDTVDGADFQGVRFSNKRGSVIDLSEGEGKVEKTERLVENRPAVEPVHTPPQPQTQVQPRPQAQFQQQPVIRRQKVNRNAEQRKSIIELEIERQREREEEVRREAELARRIQAKQQGDDKEGEKKSEEGKAKEPHPKHASERNGPAVKPPSVLKKTEKFEKKSEGFKTKEHRPKLPESSGVAGKRPEVQKQVELETIVQPKKATAVASTPAVDEVDAMQRMEDGAESQGIEFETEDERKRREKELFKQMQEEERKRREAQKEDLERIRKEVDRKEAEELIRLKLEKEEERMKLRDAERILKEEREKDLAEKQKKDQDTAAFRKTSFASHKLILEQRVLKALEDSKQEGTLPKRCASSFDRLTDMSGQHESVSSETSEEFNSGGVKLRKANFEKTEARKGSKEELQKKRYSLNLESAPLRSKHPGSVKERPPSYAADDIFNKESQAQEDVATRRKTSSNERKISKAKSLGDLSLKKGGQSDDLSAHPVFRKVSSNHDQTDKVDGFPSFSDSRIQKELEEQLMREAIVKQEVVEREKRHRLEEGKKKTSDQAGGKKQMSLNDIKRNPLPNKIQVKKPQQSSNRDSLTHSMAAHWETMLQSVPGSSEAKDKAERRKSVIELEKEEERRRAQELQVEREKSLLVLKRKEEENLFMKQKKLEEENERKKKEKEEKEKRQQRTTAMKSLFEKMGGSN